MRFVNTHCELWLLELFSVNFYDSYVYGFQENQVEKPDL